MRAFGVTSFGAADAVVELDVPVPEIGRGEVLIAVVAAGVGPWDVAQRRGWLLGGQALPLILGWECAGVVEAVGAAVSGLKCGDAVYAYAALRGNYAEYVACPADAVALKPTGLDFEQAAAVPVSGITAHQAIVDDLGVQAGETVLVTAGAGATGSLAIQIAAARGAHVLATASARNHEFMRGLGAREVIDYTKIDAVTAVRSAHAGGVECLLDCVSGENFERCLPAVRDGGRAVAIAGAPSGEQTRGVTVQRIHGRPDARRLAILSELFDSGALRVEVQESVPLLEASRAHALVEDGHVRGKVVLRVGDRQTTHLRP